MYAGENILVFQELINRLSRNEETSGRYEGYQLDLKTSDHFLKDVIASHQTSVPFILASRWHKTDDNDNILDRENCDTEVHRQDTYEDVSLISETPIGDQCVSPAERTGSPLKMQHFSTGSSITCSPSQSGGCGVQPLSAAEARQLISLYTLGVQLDAPVCTPNDHTDVLNCQPNTVNGSDAVDSSSTNGVKMNAPSLPLWVVIDGCDKKNTVALGVQITHNQGKMVHLFEVMCSGPFTADALPKYSTLLQTHVRRSRAKQVQVSTSCLAEYDVFSSFSKESTFVSTFRSPQKSLLVQLRWQQVSALQQTPPLSAIATVLTKVSVDDMQSAAYSLLSELRTLQGFCTGLKGDMVQWNYTENASSVVDTIQNLINEVKRGDAIRREEKREEVVDDSDSDFFSSVRQLLLIDRLDLDFTERLWLLIKECQSYKELTDCLQLVLNSLQNYELQAMVHKSNTSTLACLIRDSYNDQLVLPPLTGTLPLQMLVEVGLEKLTADYCNVLLGKELVTSSHLTYFVERSVTLDERVNRLEKLHYVVELVVTLEQYLNAPRPTLIESVRTALVHYEEHSVTDIHTFVTSIATNAVTGLLESCVPPRWQVFLTSDVSNESITTSCLISTKCPFKTVCQPLTEGKSLPEADCSGQQDTTNGADATVTESISSTYYVTRSFHTVDRLA